MKDHLLIRVTAVVIAAGVIIAVLPASSAQAPKSPASSAQVPQKGPGIVISVSGSATISTEGMPPGGEIWAEWYSLPPGQAVAEPASAAKWAYLEMALDGSAVVTGGPTPTCIFFVSGERPPAAAERIADAGDVEACSYAVIPGSRTENRGSQPYVFAGLSVGGPWKDGMEDAADHYLKANGQARTATIASSQFGEVEKEIIKAGAMKVGIRSVTIPPGARIITRDRYPTLRMVEKGQLTLSSIAESSGTAAVKVLSALDMMEWASANAEKQIALSNTGDQPVKFVEWSVAPAQGATP